MWSGYNVKQYASGVRLENKKYFCEPQNKLFLSLDN